MATLRWWEFKETSEAAGLNWKDVLATYNEVRAEHNAWADELKAIRQRCWALGVYKNHPAFWRGDCDLNSIPGFDLVVRSIGYEFPWLQGDDAAEELFELLAKNNSEFHMSEDECFEQALSRLQAMLDAGKYSPAISEIQTVPF